MSVDSINEKRCALVNEKRCALVGLWRKWLGNKPINDAYLL